MDRSRTTAEDVLRARVEREELTKEKIGQWRRDMRRFGSYRPESDTLYLGRPGKFELLQPWVMYTCEFGQWSVMQSYHDSESLYSSLRRLINHILGCDESKLVGHQGGENTRMSEGDVKAEYGFVDCTYADDYGWRLLFKGGRSAETIGLRGLELVAFAPAFTMVHAELCHLALIERVSRENPGRRVRRERPVR